jgi:DNA replication protein DnaC
MSEPHPNTSPPNSAKLSDLPGEFVARNCPTHGDYQARQIVPVAGMPPVVLGCPECQQEAEARDATEAARSAQRLRSDKLKELLASAAIPAKYAEVTLSDYQVTVPGQQTVKTICQTFARRWPEQYRKGGCLVLTGSCGTGKTMLACAIANTIMAEFHATVAFGMVSDLLREVKATYRADSRKTEKQAMAELAAPDLLIFDEIGVETGTEYETRMFFEIVNRRYHANKPTIMISNLTAEDLETYLGERIWERFVECGPVLVLDWVSHRRKDASA